MGRLHPRESFVTDQLTMAPLKMAGVGVGAAVGKAKGAVSKAGRKGKSMVRGRTSGESGMLGGLAGGAAMGGALANEEEPGAGGGQVESRVAQTPESPSAVPGQSSLGQYEDGAAPEQAAYGGQDYADAGAGQSGPPSLSEVDPNAVSEAEFAEAFANANPKERAKIVQDALGGQSNSKRFLSEAMGPAGGAIATVTIGAMGVSGGAAAAAGALPAAAIAYAGKESIRTGSVKTGIKNTYNAAGTLKNRGTQKVSETISLKTQSAADSSGGSGDSGGKDDGIF